jgi:hypothetical protein
VNLDYRTLDLEFQAHRLDRASLSGAIALFDLLSAELRRSDPDSSMCALTAVAAQLLRRVQAGVFVNETEWQEAFVRAQGLFEFSRGLKSFFEAKKGAQPHEQAISRSN